MTEVASSVDGDEHEADQLSDLNAAEKRHHHKLVWVVLAVLVLIGVGTGVYIVTQHHNTSSAGVTPTTNQNQATFGPPCSQNPACSGGSGSESTGPTSSELQQAYSQGYFYGQHLNGPESFCETNKYSDPELNAQYTDGCGAGYSGGGSSSEDYGGIAGNQAPSPTTPDVQPYSGGSYDGSVDPSSGGFPGAP